MPVIPALVALILLLSCALAITAAIWIHGFADHTENED